MLKPLVWSYGYCLEGLSSAIVSVRLLIWNLFKRFLIVLGLRLPESSFHKFMAIGNYMKIGRWMADHGFDFKNTKRVASKEDVWRTIAQSAGNKRVLYLEFGVFGGYSMRCWAGMLKHPESKLHGFDSFEGLPEKGGPWHAGQFNTGGIIPTIDDSRVRFFKGLFSDVLPAYIVPDHELLIINMDADLYSSTICVLRHLRDHIRVGTYIYYDEFDQIDHEPRAFDEFMNETGLKFRLFCADKTLSFVSFECIGD